MTTSKADRPYGSFPRDVPAAEAPDEAPRPRGLRPWLRARSPRERAELALTALLVALAFVLVVSALPSAPRIAELDVPPPTPTPTVPELYAKLAPTVVQVRAIVDDESSLGSGVIIDTDGNILTALHVVQGARSIQVQFADGTVAQAKILATLPENDIAALHPLQLPSTLAPATLGNPGALRIGEDAIVIGNPFGLSRSLSTGVISGLGRTVQPPELSHPLNGLIQFDASVNPGNSGGPLFNRDGDVVGIVTGLANPDGHRSFSGVGFAVTIDTAAGAIGVPPD